MRLFDLRLLTTISHVKRLCSIELNGTMIINNTYVNTINEVAAAYVTVVSLH
jgi:hypothetical protein